MLSALFGANNSSSEDESQPQVNPAAPPPPDNADEMGGGEKKISEAAEFDVIQRQSALETRFDNQAETMKGIQNQLAELLQAAKAKPPPAATPTAGAPTATAAQLERPPATNGATSSRCASSGPSPTRSCRATC